MSQLPDTTNAARPLVLERVTCCLCGVDAGDEIATGQDFEYRTSADEFRMQRCRHCGLLYLNPRPAASELGRIYPPNYHAFEFSASSFGFVYRVRRWLEARRILSWCRDLPDSARILDVGCGDGFHLNLLKQYGKTAWQLEGVDAHPLAVRKARAAGLTVHEGRIDQVNLPAGAFDLAVVIQTIEHVDDPLMLLRSISGLLKPGGKAVIVTDNADSLDARWFRARYWGGYHFPRHWNLFTRRTLTALAAKSGLAVESIGTQVSPVNWVYSIRNWLCDDRAPRRLVEFFSLKSPLALAGFTLVDRVLQLLGRGALLRAILRRPAS